MKNNDPLSAGHPWKHILRKSVLGPLLAGILLAMAASILLTGASRALVELTPGENPLLPLTVFIIILIVLLTATFTVQAVYFHIIAVHLKNDREKSVFVRMATDTIRTPVTGLRWLTELFLSGEFGAISGAQKESIVNMDAAIRRLINLLDELLKVMRMSGGLVHYNPTAADLTALLKRSAGDMNAVASAKLQRIGFGQISTDVDIWLDEPLIRHLLAALLGAAVRLGDLNTTVVLHAEPLEKDDITIGITYTGQPMLLKKDADAEARHAFPNLPPHVGDLDLTVSWEILSAAQGRFWTKHKDPEHTLFISLPRKGMARGV
ncbi:MAG: hypothetical protein WCV62_01885 [Candidatus Peribacteraceae bacterium]|jgi:signal transduction histidine kinase